MAPNAKNAPRRGAMNVELRDPATYPARVVGVGECGLQPQSHAGAETAPKQEIAFRCGFVDVFMRDEDGQEVTDKPRWLTESMPLNNVESEKAKSTARYQAMDPTGAFGGDFSKVINTPLLV